MTGTYKGRQASRQIYGKLDSHTQTNTVTNSGQDGFTSRTFFSLLPVHLFLHGIRLDLIVLALLLQCQNTLTDFPSLF